MWFLTLWTFNSNVPPIIFIYSLPNCQTLTRFTIIFLVMGGFLGCVEKLGWKFLLTLVGPFHSHFWVYTRNCFYWPLLGGSRIGFKPFSGCPPLGTCWGLFGETLVETLYLGRGPPYLGGKLRGGHPISLLPGVFPPNIEGFQTRGGARKFLQAPSFHMWGEHYQNIGGKPTKRHLSKGAIEKKNASFSERRSHL